MMITIGMIIMMMMMIMMMMIMMTMLMIIMMIDQVRDCDTVASISASLAKVRCFDHN